MPTARRPYWIVPVRIAAVAVVLAAAAAAATELAVSSAGGRKGTIHEDSFNAPALRGRLWQSQAGTWLQLAMKHLEAPTKG